MDLEMFRPLIMCSLGRLPGDWLIILLTPLTHPTREVLLQFLCFDYNSSLILLTWMEKHPLGTRPSDQTNLGKTIGNGNTTKVWSDSWIHPTSNLWSFGPLAEENQDLLVADLLPREIKEWNVAKINNLFPELINHILRLCPSILDSEDSYVWTCNI